MIDCPEEQVCMAGFRGPFPLEDVLLYARKAGQVAPLQAVRSQLVVGADHVRSAAWHAHRARDEGRAHAERPEVEFTRYLAGQRQIRTALEKMGLTDPVEEAVAVTLGPRRTDALEYFLDSLGAREDDSLLEPSMEKLAAFGIPQQAIEATTPEHRLDLVLEAVALVDLQR